MDKKVIKATYPKGTCPVCGKGQVEIGETHESEWCSGTREWTCPLCGASGEEGWEVVFTGKHYGVTDGDGNAVEITPDDSALKKLYMVTCENFCNEVLEFTEIVGVTDNPKLAQKALDTKFESEHRELVERRRSCDGVCSEIRLEHAQNVKQASFIDYGNDAEDSYCADEIKYKVSITETLMLT